jgi:hypothetical protein
MYGKMTGSEIIKLLDIVIGSTNATGSASVDDERLKNLRVLIDVTNWCLDGIKQAAETRHRPENSMREIGETAFGAIAEYKDWCEVVFNNC